MSFTWPPSWYHGLLNPNNAAATIRDGYFALLGSTEGFPYNADLFFTMYLSVFADGAYGFPQTYSVYVYDSGGSLLIQSIGVKWNQTLVVLSPTGSFSLDGTYSVVVKDLSGNVIPTTYGTGDTSAIPGSAFVFNTGTPGAPGATILLRGGSGPSSPAGGATVNTGPIPGQGSGTGPEPVP